ncbi:MAG: hypothetical protein IOC49_13770 [Methylobacterium sp.]|nr:hypothetical protein [Methylobacterium sp.]
MSLLREIQASLFEENREIGPILLKLRFLASRLGSIKLEEWVKMESEGYGSDSDVPAYRKVPISYSATFSGPFGSGIRNAPIPSILIQKYAGKNWNPYVVKQSISGIDDLIKTSRDKEGLLSIDASNLILLLQGKIYEGYACNMVKGIVSSASLSEIQNAVRSRIMELTIEIEKSIPNSHEITIDFPAKIMPKAESEIMSKITNQIIYGNVTNVSNSGQNSTFNININAGDIESTISYISENGISDEDAKQFVEILQSEDPESKSEPFGNKAKKWITDNIFKAVNGTWKSGISVATEILKEAALRYYGLK